MYWYLIGIMAALLTTFGFVPQIMKMYRTKSAKDVSIITFYQFSAGVILWTLYGFHLKDEILILANIVSLLTLVLAITLFYRYRKLE